MAGENSPTFKPLTSLSGWLTLVAFLVGIVGAFYLQWHQARTRVLISVPVRDLPAYYQIQPDDLSERAYVARDLDGSALKESTEIVYRYTLTRISQQQPLSNDQLGPVVDTALISGTVAAGIMATPAMVLGGNLQAGDIVDLIFVPSATEAQPLPLPTLFENILVFDIKTLPDDRATGDKPSAPQFVVVVAMPWDRHREFATRVAEALFISRKP